MYHYSREVYHISRELYHKSGLGHAELYHNSFGQMALTSCGHRCYREYRNSTIYRNALYKGQQGRGERAKRAVELSISVDETATRAMWKEILRAAGLEDWRSLTARRWTIDQLSKSLPQSLPRIAP